MHAFPPLQSDVRCDVAIIGAGITSALIADEFAQQGFDVVVVEKRDVGWGSSAASTSLLQYEIDTHMTDLAKRYGEPAAVLAYRSCAEAVEMVGDVARRARDVDFAPMKSLYYASRRRDRAALESEYALRLRHGFDVQWLQSEPLHEAFGFRAPCAILSALAARLDPYRLAYRLFGAWEKKGMRVHDSTTISEIVPGDRAVTLRTEDGFSIRAEHVVVAAGYESQTWLRQRIASNRSSYAYITSPNKAEVLGRLADTMVWESARPYLYLRTTGDGRVLVGGEDDSHDIPSRRDRRVEKKSRRLQKKFANLFPQIPSAPAFAWAGTFAETADGLPFFGPHQQWGRRVHFAMAYGGNGITYSMLGAGLLRALVERRKHPLSDLFGFKRVA